MSKQKTILLAELIDQISPAQCTGDRGARVLGISYDSRKVKPGYLFVALKGSNNDGHKYVREAVNKGAVAVMVQEDVESDLSIPVVKVPDSRQALARLASTYYQWPQKELSLIGITGTNGKTTTSYLLETILKEAGLRPAVIGTVNYRFEDTQCAAPVTTPESLELMKLLRKVVDMGATHGVVEVSSHALEQGRVRECGFRVGVFTNLSRDHLDYHKSMDSYFKAKSILFTDLIQSQDHGEAGAAINMDSPYGKKLAGMCSHRTVGYGLAESAEVTARDVSITKDGIKGTMITPQGQARFSCPLIGKFNVYNILAAAATSVLLGIPVATVTRGLERVRPVPGRLELIGINRSVAVAVDYAHTPDALEKVLRDLRAVVNKRIITVFGCGGDRDKGKRPEMGRIAVTLSDMVVITSDNPRTEDPALIIDDIVQGVRSVASSDTGDKTLAPYIVEADRKRAIEIAIREAQEGDLVLITGKGHEDYQIVGEEKRPFDDRKVAEEILKQVG